MSYPIMASELIEMLQEHINKYGDDNIMIEDEYSSVYKTIDKTKISRIPGDRFVITCEMEED